MPSLVKKLFATLALALMMRACALETFRVSGGAMLPTVSPGDVIIASKLHYGIRVPGSGSLIWSWSRVRKGDVVVLSGVGDPPTTIVRRVLALPGEKVKLEKGVFSIFDGNAWHENACDPIAATSEFCTEHAGKRDYIVRLPAPDDDSPNSNHKGEFDLSPNEIFVVADDRHDGPDSRHFGPVPMESIVGTVSTIWIPAHNGGKDFAVDKILPIKLNQRGYFFPIL